MGDVGGAKPVGRRVCIIGAGFAGVACLRALTRDETLCDVTVFEKNPDVGGVWYFAENAGIKGTPGYFYKDLRTNTPRQCWEFRDLPQPDDVPTYLTPTLVKAYINRYADTFSLRKNIQFESRVDSVKADGDQWSVTVSSNNTQRNYLYDYVITCIGITREPHVPAITGLGAFQGSKVHSGNFRCADEYTGRTVLIVGTRASMFDIALIVAKAAKKVYVAGTSSHPVVLPDNCSDRPAVASFTQNAAVFQDGSQTQVDDVIFCTGFGDISTFPFMDSSCGLTKKYNYAYPLYNNIVNANHTTMFVAGLFDYHHVLTLFEFIADYIETIVSGRTTLPSREAMLENIEHEFKVFAEDKETLQHAQYHCILPARQRRLHTKLSKQAGINPPDTFSYDVADHVYSTIFVDKRFHEYRNETYRKAPNGDLKICFEDEA